MTTTGLGLVLLAVCLVASAAVITATFRSLGAHSAADVFLRLIAAAGISALGSVMLELFHTAHPSVVLRAGADAAVALGPATVWVAVRSVRGRVLGPAVIAAAGVGAVAVVSAVVARPASFGVLLAVLALFCLLSVGESWRMRRTPGFVLLGSVLSVFAVYCATVLGIGLSAGWGSAPYEVASSWAVWTVVSGVSIATTGVAAMLIARGLRAGDRADPPEGSVRGRRAHVSIPDFALMPSAYGANAAAYLHGQLMRAAREIDPWATSARPGSCELASDDPPDLVERRVGARFAAFAAAEEIVLDDLVFAWEDAQPA